MAAITSEERPDRSGTVRRVYVVRYKDAGGRQRERTFAKDKHTQAYKDAKAFSVSVEHSKNTGTYVDAKAGRVLFSERADRWLETKRATRRPATVTTYDGDLRTHILPTFGRRGIASVQRSDVQAWVNAKSAELAPATVRRVYATVAVIFREAVRDRVLVYSPCDAIDLPAKDDGKVAPLTPEQVHELAAGMTQRYRATVVAGVGLGLRRSELLGLTVDRVDFLRRTVKVDRQLAADEGCVGADGAPVFVRPKTSSSDRTVPLPQVVADALAAHLAEYGPGPGGVVFTNTRGGVCRAGAFYEAWDRAIRDANAAITQANRARSKDDQHPLIPEHATPHDMRHTYASLLIAANENPKVIQARLGHKNISETFDTYGHLYPASEESTRTAIDAALTVPIPGMGTSQVIAKSSR